MERKALVERVRGEFLEMPGLRLTPAQAARVWTLDPPVCQQVLNSLVGSSFLKWTADGKVVRADP